AGLNDERRRHVEAHVETCAPCQDLLDRWIREAEGELPRDQIERPRQFEVAPANRRAQPAADAHRNLLFGVLALQMDFISREALIAAVSTWIHDKAKRLAQILVEQGALPEARRALLEPLVEEHLRVHDDDPEQSLGSVSSVGSLRDALA